MLAVADVAALLAPDELKRALVLVGCARITLCARRDIWCLVDAVDLVLASVLWNAKDDGGKFYAKRNVGEARTPLYLHRVVLQRATGVDDAFAAAHHGHHRNGQSRDCRRVNLAWLPPAQNCAIRLRREAVPSLESIVAQLARQVQDQAVAAPPY